MYTAQQFTQQRQQQRPAGQKSPYLVQKIMSASPQQLISYVYDAGIKACAKEDRTAAFKAMQVLINGLNFDHKEVSVTFYNVYRYINHCISKGNFIEAKSYLEDIKATWVKAMKVV